MILLMSLFRLRKLRDLLYGMSRRVWYPIDVLHQADWGPWVIGLIVSHLSGWRDDTYHQLPRYIHPSWLRKLYELYLGASGDRRQ